MRKIVFLLAVAFLWYACQSSTPKSSITSKPFTAFADSLDQELNTLYKGNLPGFSVAILSKDTIFYERGLGYAAKEKQIPYSTATTQMIASASKIMTAIAVMQLVEAGQVKLDDPINQYLPFEVINPNFPDIPITIRHLTYHSSSIRDTLLSDRSYLFSKPLDKSTFPEVWAPIIDGYNQNRKVSLPDFLANGLSNTGQWYTPLSFQKTPPGTTYEYSNVGIGLLGYIIELVSGKNYADYTQQYIFNPLGMKNTGWTRSEVDTINHITYYNELYNPVPNYEIITYPDGGLLTSVKDMALFMQEMLKGYAGESTFLQPSSYNEMWRIQDEQSDTPAGLVWDLENPCCIGHGGNDFGIATMFFFTKSNGIGKILFSNIALEKEALAEEYYTIFNALFKYDKMIE